MTEEHELIPASGDDAGQPGSAKSKEEAKDKEKDRKIRNKPLTKIIIRRLPPSMTEESFVEQVSPIPEHDYFYFAKPDPSLTHCGFSRAYINFVNVEDIYLFKDKFDGYIFLDEKGLEYVGIVEYSPFQRIPKKRRKKDPKCGTIESDPAYIEFLDSLNEPEGENREPKLEYSYQVNDNQDKKSTSTPLLEYLATRKQEKRGREERRRRETDKRKVRVDRKTKEAPIQEEESPESEVKKIKARDWEKDKSSPKKKDDDVRSTEGKESKSAAKPAKSYREQRKLAEEQRRKTDGEKKEYKGKDAYHSDSDKAFRKDKRDKPKESPREHKPKEVKKYSETRKERTKYEKKDDANNKSENAFETERKISKPLSHSDIKPFTQLPQVKTEDLTKVIEEMSRLMKSEEQPSDFKATEDAKTSESSTSSNSEDKPIVETTESKKISNRRKSLDSSGPTKDEQPRRQNSFEDRSQSIDRDNSLEKDKSGSDPRTERRIRNKDRPTLAIYQPGMGKFSKQRIAKDKDGTQGGTAKTEDKDT